MRRLILFLLLLFPLVSNVSTGEENVLRYFSVLPAIPLVPGFEEEKNCCTDFDSPYGRLTEARARGQGNLQDTLTYYRPILTALGWREREIIKTKENWSLHLERGKDRMEIRLHNQGDEIRLQLTQHLVEG